MPSEWNPDFPYGFERVATAVRGHRNRQDLLRGGAGSASSFCGLLEDATSDPSSRLAWLDYPWPTFVIGSGAAPQDPLYVSPDGLAQAVTKRVEAWPQEDGSGSSAGSGWMVSDPSELEPWVRSIAEGRSSSTAGSPASGAHIGVDELSEGAVMMAVLGYRLSRLYYGAQVASCHAPSRGSRDVADLGALLGSSSMRESVLLIQETVGALRRYGQDGSAVDDSERRIISAVCYLVDRDLGANTAIKPVLRLATLRYVTDIAWFMLTQQSTLYPGWTDLLLRMSIGTARGPEEAGQVLPATRPSWADLEEISRTARDVIMPMCASSYAQSLNSGEGSSPHRFHSAVADVLAAESRAVESMRAHRKDLLPTDREKEHLRSVGLNGKWMKMHDLPPASAFVTSLDLELELALWRSGTPFVVFIPVHIRVDTHPSGVGFHWLEAVIRPPAPGKAEELTAHGLPRGLVSPSEWHLVLGRPRGKRSHLPTIVRLTGSPLMDLPDTEGSFGESEWLGLVKELCSLEECGFEHFEQYRDMIVAGVESDAPDAADDVRKVFESVDRLKVNFEERIRGISVVSDAYGRELEALRSRLSESQAELKKAAVGFPSTESSSATLGQGLRQIGVGEYQSAKLYHAVILDEYSALQTSQAELAAAMKGRDSAANQTALPTSLAIDQHPVRRYWLAFGVQFAESPVRYRLFSQVTSAEIRGAQGAGGAEDDDIGGDGKSTDDILGISDAAPVRRPTAESAAEPGSSRQFGHGLAINSSLDEVDLDLLLWLGFDMVLDDCGAFADDVVGLARHIDRVSAVVQKASDPSRRKDMLRIASYKRPDRYECPLADEEATDDH